MQAAANILYKYRAVVGDKYRFLLAHLQPDDVSADIKMFY